MAAGPIIARHVGFVRLCPVRQIGLEISFQIMESATKRRLERIRIQEKKLDTLPGVKIWRSNFERIPWVFFGKTDWKISRNPTTVPGTCTCTGIRTHTGVLEYYDR
jgi:hypothetical protein